MARWREKEGRWETVGCIIVTSSISLSAIYYSLASLSTSLILHSQQKIGQCGKRLSFRRCDWCLVIRFSFLQLKDKTSYRCLSDICCDYLSRLDKYCILKWQNDSSLRHTATITIVEHINRYIAGFNTNFFHPVFFY